MKRLMKGLLPRQARVWAKEHAARFLGLPYSQFGVPPSILRHFAPGKPITLIDVGASQGSFTEAMRQYCGLRQALLIEPQPQRSQELKSRFSEPEYTVCCAAAAAESKDVQMDVLNWDYSSSVLPIRREFMDAYGDLNMDVREVITVRTATLDELCATVTGPVDLLKIDVQGAEEQVILGGTRTLERTAFIWMEISFKPLYEGSQTLEGMNKLCNERGFVLAHLEEGWRSSSTGELLQADALFLRSDRTGIGVSS